MNVRRSTNGIDLGVFGSPSADPDVREVLNEESFHRMISLERKRTERSRKPFLLMLLDTGDCLPSDRNGRVLSEIQAALTQATRETDITGWYKENAVVGVMFTEIGVEDRSAIVSTMMTRASETLRANLTFEQFNQISISFHLFPEEWDHEMPERPSNPTLYPDLARRDNSRKWFGVVKRAMDLVFSGGALICLAPVFLAIAIAIKLSSKGPVFFRQQRVGQHGVPFMFLKFRSMRVNNDPTVHRDYVRKLIAGRAERKPAEGEKAGVFKLTNDPRITAVGAFLRRTSLDEIPQFLNVFCGQMSLVGPRPAIGYEVEAYDIWHRRRVLEAKPGITGLWQVGGRSRMEFNDMVRLDLKYARTWTPWLDLKILVRTPRTVVFGEGAY